MPTFNFDADNNIRALGSQQADFEGEIFANQKELADLAKWPANLLIEVWNGIRGLTPVKKFTDPRRQNYKEAVVSNFRLASL